MRLGRLTQLEMTDLQKQLQELKKLIRDLEAILATTERQLAVLVTELDDVVTRFADDRRTTIVEDVAAFEVEDLVAEEQVVITLSHEAYIKRVPIGLYRRRVSTGRALAGMDRYEDDFLEHVFVAGTQDTLVFFTQQGQAHALAVSDVPEAGPTSRGRALAQLITLDRGDRVAALIPVEAFTEQRSLLFLTASGTVKRTTLDQYANIRSGGIAAIRVQDGDRLLDVQVSEGTNDVVLVTAQGRAIRFGENDVPFMGRVAQGVKGIQLRKDDGVIGMVVVRREATLCCVTGEGYAKRTPVSDYPAQKRGGLGTITLDVSSKTGPLVAAKELLDGDELMVITASGAATRLSGAHVPIQGRATQGRKLVAVAAGDRVVEVSRVAREGDSAAGQRRSTTTSAESGSAPGTRFDADTELEEVTGTGGEQLDLMS
jgi:DNA gyrase subunit A